MSVPRWLLPALLLVALALRLGWSLSRDSRDESLRALPDQREYVELGRNLLAGRGLVMRDERLAVDVRAFRTPGYPVFVAICGGNQRAVRIAQSFVDTSTVLAIYLLARRWLNERTSLLAAALIALNPFLIFFCALVLSETVFVAMLSWGITLLLSRGMLLVPGLSLLALAVLVRPGAIALPALLAATCAICLRRQFVASTLLALILTSLVLLPWAWRNHIVVGEWIWTSSNAGFTSYDGWNPRTGASDQSFVTEIADDLRPMGEAERSRFLSRLAWDFIQSSPFQTIKLAGLKIARTWSPMPLSRDYGTNAWLVLVSLSYTLPLFALTLTGVLRKNGLPRSAKALLLLPALYFTAAAALSVGSLRYRLPGDVPMAVIAASAVVKANRRPLPATDN